MIIDWSPFERHDDSINLEGAYIAVHGFLSNAAREFLRAVEDLQPIRSRQVAALTIVVAKQMADPDD